jgi:hypothetical protein
LTQSPLSSIGAEKGSEKFERTPLAMGFPFVAKEKKGAISLWLVSYHPHLST